jgi:GT2 family glycosyltransferase
VLCTYNRARQLRPALDALVAQAGDIPYEVLVVDNNSADDTRAVVEGFVDGTGGRVRYAFEGTKGLSHARNHGIALARAPLVAFSDDDVRVAPDWVQQVVRAFEEHPNIDYVGGRVLPRWLQPPPRWLTTAHWSPLALQDYGTDTFVSSQARAICLVGANLAFRRRVFDRVGSFTPELGRIKDGIGSTEDHDLQLRVWRAGMCGLYAPDVVADADVTPDRMVKSYHRRWHRGHGRHCATMRLRELVPADFGPMSEPRDIVPLFGSPAFVYADLALFAWRWWAAVIRRQDSFFYANKLRHLWSYLRRSREMCAADGRRGSAAELTAFVSAYREKRRAHRLAHRTS